METTRKIPAAALHFDASATVFAEDADGLRKFSGVAYAGGVITGHFYWSRDAFERDIEVLECNWTIDTVWCNSTATCAGVGQRGHPLRRSARQPAAARTAQQVVGGAARGAGDGSGVCGMNQLRPALFSSATTSSSASPVKQTRRNTRRPANHPLTMAATSPKSMAMANAASMKTR